MADKKFYGPEGKLESVELNEDHETAKLFDKFKIGKLGVYYRDTFKLKFLPYDFIERAFIRIHETNARTCCACNKYRYYTLEFVHDGKEYSNVISENEKLMDDALELIHQMAPQIKIGFEKNE